MDRETIILGINHELIASQFLNFASSEYGAIKINDVLKKVHTSGKLAKFLNTARNIRAKIDPDYFLAATHSSSSFVFCKAEIIAIATVLLFEKWVNEIGALDDFSANQYLNTTFFAILDKCNKFKTHIKSSLNFFEKFEYHLNKCITIDIIKNSSSEVKDEVSFDSFLCRAVKAKEKIEFRTPENLSGINIDPNDWELDSYSLNDGGAFFASRYFQETVLIKFPYKLGCTINVFDYEFPKTIDSQIEIKSIYLQRLKEVEQRDARNEGFGAYKEKVKELENKDPSLDAEYCLFVDDWTEKYNTSLSDNHWLWTFEFELKNKINIEVTKAVKAQATSAGLSEAEIETLLKISI